MQHIDLSRVEQEAPSNGATRDGILVVGSDEWAIGNAVSQLRAVGRTVHRCCDSADVPFPCNALVPGRGCPLDLHEVGVVLDVRPRPRAEPTLSEIGALCGLRAGIPLVTAGVPDINGFGPWATQVPAAGDVVTSCDDALQVNQ
jgi:hypothetical protein